MLKVRGWPMILTIEVVCNNFGCRRWLRVIAEEMTENDNTEFFSRAISLKFDFVVR